MGSVGICGALSLYTLLKYSWRSFKLLKTQTVFRDGRIGQKSFVAEGISPDGGVSVVKAEGGVVVGKVATSVAGVERKAELVYLLQFWTIYAVLTLYEYYLEFIVALVPFYYTVKFVFLLYINIQQTKGVEVIFEGIVQPYIVRAERFLVKVMLPPLVVLPKAIEEAVLPCLSLYRLEATIEYLQELIHKLQEERSRRLVTIDLNSAAKAKPVPPSLFDSSAGDSTKEVLVATPKDGVKLASDDVKVLTEQEQMALAPTSEWNWGRTLPNMMNSVIGLTVQTKDLFAGKPPSNVSVNLSKDSAQSEEVDTDRAPTTPTQQQIGKAKMEMKMKMKVKRRFSLSSTSSADSSGSSSDSSSSSSSDGVDGTLGRYRLVDSKLQAKGRRPGKYEQGFRFLGEYEEESPVKAGADYMDSVIAMMKGIDTEESQAKRNAALEK